MINIFYLSHNRINFSKLTFYYLNKIKPENKNKIRLNILATHDTNWELTKLENIDFDIKVFPNQNNYLAKIKYAVSLDGEYSIKLDEDCFINNHVWDFIIENIGYLNDENNLLLSPIMSNNIPSCDIFIEKYIDDQIVLNSIYTTFLNRAMPNGLWGVDYSPLNEFTIHSNNWNYSEFYNGVSQLNTNIKGIHPLRISYEAQLLINDYILNNINKFQNRSDYNIIEIQAPYFTNSLFAIKTSEWRNIVNSKNMDGYDEIALNKYKQEHNKNFLFIDNGFGIHPMYNTVFGNKNPWNIGVENGEELEIIFYNKLEKLIIK